MYSVLCRLRTPQVLEWCSVRWHGAHSLYKPWKPEDFCPCWWISQLLHLHEVLGRICAEVEWWGYLPQEHRLCGCACTASWESTVFGTFYCCCSVAKSYLTLCDHMDCRTPGFLFLHHLQGLLKLLSTELVMPLNHLILYCPLLILPSIFPSIRVFSNESDLHTRWPKYWGFSFSISPSIEYSGLISFRIDWFDLLAVQRTLKCLLQHQSSKASILWCSDSLRSNSHIRTWLLEKPQVGTLSVKRHRCFLICCLGLSKLFSQGASIFNFVVVVTVCSDFRVQENKICHGFHFLPIYLPRSDGTGCHNLSFLNVHSIDWIKDKKPAWISFSFSTAFLRVKSSSWLDVSSSHQLSPHIGGTDSLKVREGHRLFLLNLKVEIH